jgi:uncharacterized protein YbjT (DUF2867 family)
MKIIVAGGTGRAGRVVAALAAQAGHDVRALARSTGGPPLPVPLVRADLLSGLGLAEALDGADAVLDLSNTSAASHRRASRFFTTATRRLVDAERAAGVQHHVVLSIVGADRFPLGYYRAKVDQERTGAALCAAAGVVHTVARVTQFHDFAAMTYAGGRVGPLVLAAPLHLRPVDLHDVATHLLDVLEQREGGRAPDLSGPRPEELDEMVALYAARQPVRRRVVRLPLPGPFGRANRARVLAPEDGKHGHIGFGDWLDAQTQGTAGAATWGAVR